MSVGIGPPAGRAGRKNKPVVNKRTVDESNQLPLVSSFVTVQTNLKGSIKLTLSDKF